MNAKPRDVQAGWRLFRDSNFTMTLQELNAELTRRGFNAISGRTYGHYRKLERYGYERYVPINQLDVETLRNPVWDTPLRNRYRIRKTELAIRLTLIVDDDLITLEGEAQSLSETEISVVFRGARAWGALSERKDLEGAHALVTFVVGSLTKSAVIDLIELDQERQAATVALTFLTLVPAYRLEGRQAIASADLRLTLTSEGTALFADAIRELFAVFQAVDSARLVCDDVLSDLDPDRQLVLPPPEIRRLEIGSPIQIELTGAQPYILLMLGLALAYVKVWRGHQKGAIDRQVARSLRIKNDRVEFRIRMEQGDLVAYVVRLVRSAMPRESREEATHREVDVDRVRGLIERQLLPDLDSVFDENLEDINLESESEAPPIPGADDQNFQGDDEDPEVG